MTARPKFKYVRSDALRRAVASLPCQWCGRVGDTQCSHSNQAKHGHGRGIKSSDEYSAALCVRHHAMVDSSYSMTGQEREDMWQAAHEKTVHELIKQWLWPTDVQYPDWLK